MNQDTSESSNDENTYAEETEFTDEKVRKKNSEKCRGSKYSLRSRKQCTESHEHEEKISSENSEQSVASVHSEKKQNSIKLPTKNKSESTIANARKKIALVTQAVHSLRHRKKESQASTVAISAPSVPSLACSNLFHFVEPEERVKLVPGVKPSSEIVMVTEEKIEVSEVLSLYTSISMNIPKDQNCCICCEKLRTISVPDDDVIVLIKCKHLFHKLCVMAMYSCGIQDGSLQCPVCKDICGTKTGNQPFGKMDYYVVPCCLPEFECDTIVITYYIRPGIQNTNHPHPGEEYTCRGFPRRCYLPNNEDGRKILSLLITAWERRLIFTIGTSATTGEEDTVTWNEIHHKTEFGTNYSGHGYPDPTYFDNVLQELALQGVVPLMDDKS